MGAELVPRRAPCRAVGDHRAEHHRGSARREGGGGALWLRSQLPEKLWSIWGGGRRAKEALERIVENVDVLMSNQAARRASDVGAMGQGGGGYSFAQLIIHEIPKRSVSAPK